MPEYAMPSSSHTINSHSFLIGPPLLVILMFCFAFVILRPQTPSHVQPVASTHPTVSSGTTQSPLPDIPYNSQPTLMQLTTDGTTATSPPTAGVTGLQLSNTSAGNLQAARPNNQKTGSGDKKLEIQPLIYKLLR